MLCEQNCQEAEAEQKKQKAGDRAPALLLQGVGGCQLRARDLSQRSKATAMMRMSPMTMDCV